MNQKELEEQAKRIIYGPPQKRLLKRLSLVSGLLGLAILAFVILPIVTYQVSPTVTSNQTAPDYTKASNWFVGGRADDFAASQVGYYNLSIPKLGIENAIVAIGGEDLGDSLIQYPGTAVPGKRGNAVVFGHSILPQFYNPKDYISIFSTLPTLESGDEILAQYDGVTYKYRVENIFEVKPTDIQILEQNASDSFMTLVTCVPPGHPLRPKRLIVRARVVPLSAQGR